ncbi:MAG: YciK family oxidoreductase [Pseudomonadota bacterium]
MQDPKNYDAAAGLLDDRIILVTGATDGIGKALAIRCAELGARVIVHGRNVKKLEAVYDEIEAIDGAPRPSIVVLDLEKADAAAYTSLADNLEAEYGRLDGLVHNASILGERYPLEQYDVVMWQRVMHVNVTAAFALTQVLLPMLKASDDPSVIFTSSGVGTVKKVGKAHWGAYSVSKYAGEAIGYVLSEEFAHTRLRSNIVNPGPVRTKLRASAYPAEDRESVTLPGDMLAAYLYLLGPDSQGVTGELINAQ